MQGSTGSALLSLKLQHLTLFIIDTNRLHGSPDAVQLLMSSAELLVYSRKTDVA